MNKYFNPNVLINRLLQQTDTICLTVIIPFCQRGGWNKHQISHQVTKASKYFHTQQAEIIQHFEAVLTVMNHEGHYNRHCSGIGLYISKQVQEIIRFVYPVKEKFTVSDRFDMGDLLYHAQYAQPGYVLQLTGKRAHLFISNLQEAREITSGHFPLEHNDDYEYSPPSQASSYGGYAVTQQFEKDKSLVQETHYESFLRQVDQHISAYINHHYSFVITGSSKAVAAFQAITAHKKYIAGALVGHFPHASMAELHQRALPVFRQHADMQISSSIRLLTEKIGEGLTVTGITDCWDAATEGKGLLLLIEKDYAVVGFLEEGDEAHFYLTPPKKKHRIITNAANELIFTVLAKKGRVLITQSGLLQDHQMIGLIKRYV